MGMCGNEADAAAAPLEGDEKVRNRSITVAAR